MYTTILSTVLLASVTFAATPPGFEPSSSSDLTVAFGDTLAVDGVDLPRPITQTAPTVGTAEQLFGTYTLIMVDPDIPPQTPGGPTGQLLHWMQDDLVSAGSASNVAGRRVFELVSPTNTTPIAAYRGPAPPARYPFSHRYTQLLVNTTGNSAALAVLTAAGATRRPFSAQDVVTAAGLTILAGNWFNVTNSSTSTSPTASGTGGTPTTTGVPFEGVANLVSPSAAVLGLAGLMVLLL